MSESRAVADEWLEAVHREFARESDRGAALVVAAMLDDTLGRLLEKRLQRPLSQGQSLLEGYQAPLGSLAARIDAALGVELISRSMARDLHLIRKIRNDFAHEPRGRSFESEEIRSRVRELERGSNCNARDPQTRAAVGPEGTRWDFLGSAAWMLYALNRAIDDVVRPAEHPAEFGYIDWTRVPLAVREWLAKHDAT